MRLAPLLGIATLAAALGMVTIAAGCGDPAERLVPPTATPTATPVPAATATPAATPTPLPTPTPTPSPTPLPPRSYLEEGTLLTIYGRAFGIAPILGLLGSYESFDHLARDLGRFVEPIQRVNGGRRVIPAIHLIYGLAIPCEPSDDCLLYLDSAGVDIVREYVEPAAERGWLVILDSQNGRASPLQQVRRMIDRGYLQYDNVHVALDPEFAVVPGHDVPGIPIGTVEADAINEVQALLDEYVRANGLTRKKLLIVHQFGDPNVDDGVPYMIQNKQRLATFENVDLVLDADGFGAPDAKVSKYNRMLDHEVYPFIRWRGIKVFYPNPYEQAGHYDKPPMDFETLFGLKDTPGGQRMRYPPDLIVIA